MDYWIGRAVADERPTLIPKVFCLSIPKQKNVRFEVAVA